MLIQVSFSNIIALRCFNNIVTLRCFNNIIALKCFSNIVAFKYFSAILLLQESFCNIVASTMFSLAHCCFKYVSATLLFESRFSTIVSPNKQHYNYVLTIWILKVWSSNVFKTIFKICLFKLVWVMFLQCGSWDALETLLLINKVQIIISTATNFQEFKFW